MVDGLRPHTNYQLRLIAENIRGRSPPSEPTRSFQTLQTYPEKAPEKLFAQPISAHQISVDWAPLLPEEWNGHPIGYNVRYRRAVNSSSTSVGRRPSKQQHSSSFSDIISVDDDSEKTEDADNLRKEKEVAMQSVVDKHHWVFIFTNHILYLTRIRSCRVISNC